jgi:hypothetical protein
MLLPLLPDSPSLPRQMTQLPSLLTQLPSLLTQLPSLLTQLPSLLLHRLLHFAKGLLYLQHLFPKIHRREVWNQFKFMGRSTSGIGTILEVWLSHSLEVCRMRC